MNLWWHDGAKPAGSTWPAFFVGLFVSVGGILFGYDTASISGIIAMDYWNKEMATHHTAQGEPYVTTSQYSLVVSILAVGTCLGALTAGVVGDALGRRWGLIVSCMVFNVGAALQTASTTMSVFIGGRVVAGFGVGLVSALVPLYQSESVPKHVRGMVVGTYQLSIFIGAIIAAGVNNATGNNNDTSSYRIPVAVQIVWGLILAGGMLMLPETPSYLTKVDKHDEAVKSLAFFHRLPADHPEIVQRRREIQANLDFERSFGNGSYLTCFRPPFLKRLLTGCGVQAFQELSGVTFIYYYGTQFFKESGVSKPFLITVIINISGFLGVLPGLWFVEKTGRRSLLLVGAVGMFLCQLLIGIVGVTTSSTGAGGKVEVTFACLFMFLFGMAWGPGAWIVTGEIFPTHIRAKALAMTSATSWFFNFLTSFVAPYMVDDGPGDAGLGVKVFFIWSAFCFVSIFWTWFCIYETKGLSLEEVDEMYNKVNRAWHSPKYRRELRAETLTSGSTDKEGGVVEAEIVSKND